MKMVFHFVPKGGAAQTLLDTFCNGYFRPVDSRTVRNVVKDGFGKRVGTLKNHAYPAAQRRDVLVKDILSIQQNLTFKVRAPNRLVHSVERAQKSGFSATRGADEGGNPVRGDAHADVEERLFAAVEKIDRRNGHAHGEGRGGLTCRGVGPGWRKVDGHGWPHRSVHG